MDKKTKISTVVGIVVILFLISICMYLFFRTIVLRRAADKSEKTLAGVRENLTALEKKTMTLEEKLQELKSERDELENKVKRQSDAIADYRLELHHQPRLSRDEIAELKGKGLKEPEREIKEDLMKRSELIPYSGVLGGTMQFLSERDIHVLSTKWVRAYFEDGHIGGWILLEYEIDEIGGFSWKVIESYRD